MRSLLLAGVAMCCASSFASAANVAAFSQTSQSNTVTATVNGTDTVTTLSILDATLSIGQFLGNPLLPPALFTLNAHSIDAATTLGAAAIQHYTGSFCITSGSNCNGTNILSGNFSDAAFGAVGGPGLVVNVNNPPDTLFLSSAFLTPAELQAPSSFGLTFTNLVPNLAILGSTIAPFTASFAGTVSANAAEVSEPLPLAVLGVGILGLAMVRRRGSTSH